MSGTTGPNADLDAEESTIRDCEDCVAPAEAFSVIANETRLSILEALWKASDRPVNFSELRREVGMRDSAQFNYHLKQLTDHFVVQTDDGYDFRQAGKKVVRAILAGSFNEHPEMGPFDVEGTCATCDGGLQAYYSDEMLVIECKECEKNHGCYPFPPGGLNDRTREEIMDAFNQRVRHLHCLAADGVCPECNGRMSTTITRDDEDFLGLEVRVDHECEQCHHQLYSAVGLSLLDQSDVVTFHREHGVDLCTTPYWDLAWCVSDEQTTILSEDPWQILVEIPLDDEVLSVTLDGDLTVLELERSCRSASSDGTQAVSD
ncbi:ArsR/SmtB family transcription factor [Halorussus aquaticus]|uniref:ArsR/SmtB family transcription factor n=1 Tax=Halorussus aquaticus TaxID=2953748 RepID=A0ABD5Q6I5_9EURY|nr:winged helix-turn-helix domain-containing protein [Halorussus aquaticus]